MSKRARLFSNITLWTMLVLLCLISLLLYINYYPRVAIHLISDDELYESIDVKKGGVIPVLPKPSKTGAHFSGWYLDKDYTEPYDFTTQLDEDVELYAKFELIDYTLTFYVDGNKDLYAPVTMHYNDKLAGGLPTGQEQLTTDNVNYFTLENYKGEGYEFAGWSTSPSAETVNYAKGSDFYMQPNNVDLYAIWTPKNFNVTYTMQSLNLGNINVEQDIIETNGNFQLLLDETQLSAYTTEAYAYSKKIFAPADPVDKNGNFVFAGWYLDKDFTKPINFNQTYMGINEFVMSTLDDLYAEDEYSYWNNGNIMLYSKWYTKNYDVEYNLNTPYGSKIDELALNPNDYTIVNGQVKLKGIYNVFQGVELNLHALSDDVSAQKYVMRYTSTNKPSHKFVGWFTEKEGGTKIETASKFDKQFAGANGTLTLYAQWEQYYEIRYVNKTELGSDYVTVGSKFNLKTLSELDSSYADANGYSFNGWVKNGQPGKVYLAGSGYNYYAHLYNVTETEGIFTFPQNGTNVVLYANIIPNEYQITYDLKNGLVKNPEMDEAGNVKLTDDRQWDIKYIYKPNFVSDPKTKINYYDSKLLNAVIAETGGKDGAVLYEGYTFGSQTERHSIVAPYKLDDKNKQYTFTSYENGGKTYLLDGWAIIGEHNEVIQTYKAGDVLAFNNLYTHLQNAKKIGGGLYSINLVAVWAEEVTITFAQPEGEGFGGLTPTSVKGMAGTTVYLPQEVGLTRAFHNFIGWAFEGIKNEYVPTGYVLKPGDKTYVLYTDNTYTTEMSFAPFETQGTFFKNTTLYPIWTGVEYTLNVYNSNENGQANTTAIASPFISSKYSTSEQKTIYTAIELGKPNGLQSAILLKNASGEIEKTVNFGLLSVAGYELAGYKLIGKDGIFNFVEGENGIEISIFTKINGEYLFNPYPVTNEDTAVSIMAYYELMDYTVTVVTEGVEGVEGGTTVELTEIDYGTLINTLTKDGKTVFGFSLKTGYQFAGWEVTKKGSDTVIKTITDLDNSADVVDGDLVITLKAELITYNVSVTYVDPFNIQNNVTKNDSVKHGYAVSSSNVLKDLTEATEYTGFIFKGYKDDSGEIYSTIADIKDKIITGIINFTTVYEAMPVNVVFHANNGTDASTTQITTYNTIFAIIPNTFSYAGFRWNNWAFDQTGNTVVSSADLMKRLTTTNFATMSLSEGTYTLNVYAVWQELVTLTLLTESGVTITGVTSSINLDKGSSITLKQYVEGASVSKTGYVFSNKWVINGGDYDNKIVTESDNITLTANTTFKPYFNDADKAEITVKYFYKYAGNDTKYEFAPEGIATSFKIDDVLTLYTFDGSEACLKIDGMVKYQALTWILQTNSYNQGEKVTLNADIIEQNGSTNFEFVITLEKQYSVIYRQNYIGAPDGVVLTVINNVEYTIGNYDGMDADIFAPERTGYTLSGWNTEADGSGTTYANGTKYTFTGTNDIVLYAVWVANDVTVTYFTNNGTDALVTNTVKFDNEFITLGKKDVTYDGYRLMSWNTMADGSGKTLILAGKYLASSYATENAINLYAQWQKEYVITFAGNGTDEKTLEKTYIKGEKFNIIALPNAFKAEEGYSFAGTWKYAGTDYTVGEEFTLPNTLTDTDTIVFTANWEIDKMIVTLTYMEGYETYTTYTSEEIPYGNKFELTGILTRIEGALATDGIYTLKGWATSANGEVVDSYGNSSTFTITEVKNGVTLYAIYDKYYTLTYENRNGSVLTSSELVNGTQVTSFETLTADENEIFYGWQDKDNTSDYYTVLTEGDLGFGAFAGLSLLSLNRNITLKPVFIKTGKIIVYTTISENEGVVTFGGQTEADITLGSTISFADYMSERIVGWDVVMEGANYASDLTNFTYAPNKNPAYTSTSSFTITSADLDKTNINIIFVPMINVKVMFTAGENNNSFTNITKTIIAGELVEEASIDDTTEMYFEFWADETGVAFDFENTKVYKDTILTAQYHSFYSISYLDDEIENHSKLNIGGLKFNDTVTLAGVNNTAFDETQVTYAKTGRDLLGWYLSFEDGSYYEEDGNMVLFALNSKFELKNYVDDGAGAHRYVLSFEPAWQAHSWKVTFGYPYIANYNATDILTIKNGENVLTNIGATFDVLYGTKFDITKVSATQWNIKFIDKTGSNVVISYSVNSDDLFKATYAFTLDRLTLTNTGAILNETFDATNSNYKLETSNEVALANRSATFNIVCNPQSAQINVGVVAGELNSLNGDNLSAIGGFVDKMANGNWSTNVKDTLQDLDLGSLLNFNAKAKTGWEFAGWYYQLPGGELTLLTANSEINKVVYNSVNLYVQFSQGRVTYTSTPTQYLRDNVSGNNSNFGESLISTMESLSIVVEAGTLGDGSNVAYTIWDGTTYDNSTQTIKIFANSSFKITANIASDEYYLYGAYVEWNGGSTTVVAVNGTVEYTNSSTQDHTYRLIFARHQFTVNVVGFADEQLGELTVDYGTSIKATTLAEYEPSDLTYYEFAGWDTTLPYTVTTDTTITAVWTDLYVLDLVYDSATTVDTTIEGNKYKVGDSITLPTPSKTNWIYNGWATKNNQTYTTYVVSVTDVINTATGASEEDKHTIQLTAQFTKGTVDIVFYDHNNTQFATFTIGLDTALTSEQWASVTGANSPDDYTVSDLIYTFKSWTGVNAETTYSADTSVYASYEEVFKVTFKNTLTDATQEFYTIYNEDVSAVSENGTYKAHLTPSRPTADNYSFANWKVEGTAKTFEHSDNSISLYNVFGEKPSSHNITILAEFSTLFSIQFLDFDGTVLTTLTKDNDGQDIKDGSVITTPNWESANASQYVFVSWKVNAQVSETEKYFKENVNFTLVESAHVPSGFVLTFTAQVEHLYFIKFVNADETDSNLATITAQKDTTITIPAEYTLADIDANSDGLAEQTFVNWNLNGTNYNLGSTYSVLASDDTNNDYVIVFKPVYKNIYYVQFTNIDDNVISALTVDRLDENTPVTMPAKLDDVTYFYFVGWELSTDTSVFYEALAAGYTVNADHADSQTHIITFNAVYDELYYIQFSDINNNVVSSLSKITPYKAGDKVTILATDKLDNTDTQTFIKWSVGGVEYALGSTYTVVADHAVEHYITFTPVYVSTLRAITFASSNEDFGAIDEGKSSNYSELTTNAYGPYYIPNDTQITFNDMTAKLRSESKYWAVTFTAYKADDIELQVPYEVTLMFGTAAYTLNYFFDEDGKQYNTANPYTVSKNQTLTANFAQGAVSIIATYYDKKGEAILSKQNDITQGDKLNVTYEYDTTKYVYTSISAIMNGENFTIAVDNSTAGKLIVTSTDNVDYNVTISINFADQKHTVTIGTPIFNPENSTLPSNDLADIILADSSTEKITSDLVEGDISWEVDYSTTTYFSISINTTYYSIEKVEYTYGDTTIELTNGGLGSTRAYTINGMPNEDVTIIITFIYKNVTVTFDNGHGTTVNVTKQYNDVLTNADIPAEFDGYVANTSIHTFNGKNYKFAGWKPEVEETQLTSDVTTITAQYNPVYTINFLNDKDEVEYSFENKDSLATQITIPAHLSITTETHICIGWELQNTDKDIYVEDDEYTVFALDADENHIIIFKPAYEHLYTIKFVNADGTDSILENITAQKNTSVTIPENYTLADIDANSDGLEEQSFVNWNLNGTDYNLGSSYTINASDDTDNDYVIVFTPVYKDVYHVQFVDLNGYVVFKVNNLDAGATATVAKRQPNTSTQLFSHWELQTSREGATTFYQADGAYKVDALDADDNHIIKFNAEYTDVYHIQFVDKDDKVIENIQYQDPNVQDTNLAVGATVTMSDALINTSTHNFIKWELQTSREGAIKFFEVQSTDYKVVAADADANHIITFKAVYNPALMGISFGVYDRINGGITSFSKENMDEYFNEVTSTDYLYEMAVFYIPYGAEITFEVVEDGKSWDVKFDAYKQNDIRLETSYEIWIRFATEDFTLVGLYEGSDDNKNYYGPTKPYTVSKNERLYADFRAGSVSLSIVTYLNNVENSDIIQSGLVNSWAQESKLDLALTFNNKIYAYSSIDALAGITATYDADKNPTTINVTSNFDINSVLTIKLYFTTASNTVTLVQVDAPDDYKSTEIGGIEVIGTGRGFGVTPNNPTTATWTANYNETTTFTVVSIMSDILQITSVKWRNVGATEWTELDLSSSYSITMPASDVELYVIFDYVPVTVTFEYQYVTNTTITETQKTISKLYNDTLTASDISGYNGFTVGDTTTTYDSHDFVFRGWSGGNPDDYVKKSTQLTGNITFTAIFDAEVTIYFVDETGDSITSNLYSDEAGTTVYNTSLTLINGKEITLPYWIGSTTRATGWKINLEDTASETTYSAGSIYTLSTSDIVNYAITFKISTTENIYQLQFVDLNGIMGSKANLAVNDTYKISETAGDIDANADGYIEKRFANKWSVNGTSYSVNSTYTVNASHADENHIITFVAEYTDVYHIQFVDKNDNVIENVQYQDPNVQDTNLAVGDTVTMGDALINTSTHNFIKWELQTSREGATTSFEAQSTDYKVVAEDAAANHIITFKAVYNPALMGISFGVYDRINGGITSFSKEEMDPYFNEGTSTDYLYEMAVFYIPYGAEITFTEDSSQIWEVNFTAYKQHDITFETPYNMWIAFETHYNMFGFSDEYEDDINNIDNSYNASNPYCVEGDAKLWAYFSMGEVALNITTYIDGEESETSIFEETPTRLEQGTTLALTLTYVETFNTNQYKYSKNIYNSVENANYVIINTTSSGITITTTRNITSAVTIKLYFTAKTYTVKFAELEGPGDNNTIYGDFRTSDGYEQNLSQANLDKCIWTVGYGQTAYFETGPVYSYVMDSISYRTNSSSDWTKFNATSGDIYVVNDKYYITLSDAVIDTMDTDETVYLKVVFSLRGITATFVGLDGGTKEVTQPYGTILEESKLIPSEFKYTDGGTYSSDGNYYKFTGWYPYITGYDFTEDVTFESQWRLLHKVVVSTNCNTLDGTNTEQTSYLTSDDTLTLNSLSDSDSTDSLAFYGWVYYWNNTKTYISTKGTINLSDLTGLSTENTQTIYVDAVWTVSVSLQQKTDSPNLWWDNPENDYCVDNSESYDATGTIKITYGSKVQLARDTSVSDYTIYKLVITEYQNEKVNCNPYTIEVLMNEISNNANTRPYSFSSYSVGTATLRTAGEYLKLRQAETSISVEVTANTNASVFTFNVDDIYAPNNREYAGFDINFKYSGTRLALYTEYTGTTSGLSVPASSPKYIEGDESLCDLLGVDGISYNDLTKLTVYVITSINQIIAHLSSDTTWMDIDVKEIKTEEGSGEYELSYTLPELNFTPYVWDGGENKTSSATFTVAWTYLDNANKTAFDTHVYNTNNTFYLKDELNYYIRVSSYTNTYKFSNVTDGNDSVIAGTTISENTYYSISDGVVINFNYVAYTYKFYISDIEYVTYVVKDNLTIEQLLTDLNKLDLGAAAVNKYLFDNELLTTSWFTGWQTGDLSDIGLSYDGSEFTFTADKVRYANKDIYAVLGNAVTNIVTTNIGELPADTITGLGVNPTAPDKFENYRVTLGDQIGETGKYEEFTIKFASGSYGISSFYTYGENNAYKVDNTVKDANAIPYPTLKLNYAIRSTSITIRIHGSESAGDAVVETDLGNALTMQVDALTTLNDLLNNIPENYWLNDVTKNMWFQRDNAGSAWRASDGGPAVKGDTGSIYDANAYLYTLFGSEFTSSSTIEVSYCLKRIDKNSITFENGSRKIIRYYADGQSAKWYDFGEIEGIMNACDINAESPTTYPTYTAKGSRYVYFSDGTKSALIKNWNDGILDDDIPDVFNNITKNITFTAIYEDIYTIEFAVQDEDGNDLLKSSYFNQLYSSGEHAREDKTLIYTAGTTLNETDLKSLFEQVSVNNSNSWINNWEYVSVTPSSLTISSTPANNKVTIVLNRLGYTLKLQYNSPDVFDGMVEEDASQCISVTIPFKEDGTINLFNTSSGVKGLPYITGHVGGVWELNTNFDFTNTTYAWNANYFIGYKIGDILYLPNADTYELFVNYDVSNGSLATIKAVYRYGITKNTITFDAFKGTIYGEFTYPLRDGTGLGLGTFYLGSTDGVEFGGEIGDADGNRMGNIDVTQDGNRYKVIIPVYNSTIGEICLDFKGIKYPYYVTGTFEGNKYIVTSATNANYGMNGNVGVTVITAVDCHSSATNVSINIATAQTVTVTLAKITDVPSGSVTLNVQDANGTAEVDITATNKVINPYYGSKIYSDGIYYYIMPYDATGYSETSYLYKFWLSASTGYEDDYDLVNSAFSADSGNSVMANGYEVKANVSLTYLLVVNYEVTFKAVMNDSTTTPLSIYGQTYLSDIKVTLKNYYSALSNYSYNRPNPYDKEAIYEGYSLIGALSAWAKYADSNNAMPVLEYTGYAILGSAGPSGFTDEHEHIRLNERDYEVGAITIYVNFEPVEYDYELVIEHMNGEQYTQGLDMFKVKAGDITISNVNSTYLKTGEYTFTNSDADYTTVTFKYIPASNLKIWYARANAISVGSREEGTLFSLTSNNENLAFMGYVASGTVDVKGDYTLRTSGYSDNKVSHEIEGNTLSYTTTAFIQTHVVTIGIKDPTGEELKFYYDTTTPENEGSLTTTDLKTYTFKMRGLASWSYTGTNFAQSTDTKAWYTAVKPYSGYDKAYYYTANLAESEADYNNYYRNVDYATWAGLFDIVYNLIIEQKLSSYLNTLVNDGNVLYKTSGQRNEALEYQAIYDPTKVGGWIYKGFYKSSTLTDTVDFNSNNTYNFKFGRNEFIAKLVMNGYYTPEGGANGQLYRLTTTINAEGTSTSFTGQIAPFGAVPNVTGYEYASDYIIRPLYMDHIDNIANISVVDNAAKDRYLIDNNTGKGYKITGIKTIGNGSYILNSWGNIDAYGTETLGIELILEEYIPQYTVTVYDGITNEYSYTENVNKDTVYYMTAESIFNTKRFDSDSFKDSLHTNEFFMGFTTTNPLNVTQINASTFYVQADVNEAKVITKDTTLYCMWQNGTTTTGTAIDLGPTTYTAGEGYFNCNGNVGTGGIFNHPGSAPNRMLALPNWIKNGDVWYKITSWGDGWNDGMWAFDILYMNRYITSMQGAPTSGNDSLQKVLDTDFITTITEYSFADCPKLTTFGDENGTIDLTKITGTIGASAFYRCSSITQVTMGGVDNKTMVCWGPSGIGSWAFRECTSLKTVTTGGQKGDTPTSNLTTIGDSAFQGCTALKTVSHLMYVTTIGAYAFYDCPAFKGDDINSDGSLRLNAITSVGDYAFTTSAIGTDSSTALVYNENIASANAITSIIFNTTTNFTIGIRAFAYNKKLDGTIDLTKCTSVGQEAFFGCITLNEAKTSSSTIIGDAAFKNNTALTKIGDTSSLGDYAFANCTNLTTTGVLGDNIYDHMFEGSNNIQTIGGIANSIIGTHFQNSTTLKTIGNIGGQVYKEVFKGCTALESVGNIGMGVGASAFYGCTSLTTVGDIGGDVLKEAFTVCIELAQVGNIGGTVGEAAFSACHELVYVGTLGNSSYTTYAIGKNAFQECAKLATIDLKYVTDIGALCFQGCSSLQTINISKVTYIQEKAFIYCTALTTLGTLSKLTKLGAGAFWGCTALTTVDFTATELLNLELQGENIFKYSGVTEVILWADNKRKISVESTFVTSKEKKEINFFGSDNITKLCLDISSTSKEWYVYIPLNIKYLSLTDLGENYGFSRIRSDGYSDLYGLYDRLSLETLRLDRTIPVTRITYSNGEYYTVSFFDLIKFNDYTHPFLNLKNIYLRGLVGIVYIYDLEYAAPRLESWEIYDSMTFVTPEDYDWFINVGNDAPYNAYIENGGRIFSQSFTGWINKIINL